MDNINQDQEIERRNHPENFEEDFTEEGNELIDLLEDTLLDLDKYSANHDDCLNSEVYEIGELIKRARIQLNS